MTRSRLAGPSFRRMGRDVYVDASVADTIELRARAISLAVPDGVIGGLAAAEFLDAPCGSRGAEIDIVVGRRRVRPLEGVVVHQDLLAGGEVIHVDGVAVTAPVRTAYDLARRLGHEDAVVAVDALAHRWRFDPADLLDYPALRANPRGGRNLAGVVAAADPRSASPPETRMRLLLLASDVPPPTPQYRVLDRAGRFVGRIDFAWPSLKIGLEYQGDHHRTDRWQYTKDTRRAADLAAAGWLILPVTADDLFRHPGALVARLRRAIAERRSERAA